MLRLANLTLARGARRLIEGADVTVHDGHKVGLVGANGTGKSTLFAALRGELLPDAGSIDLPARWTVAHVAQETPPVDAPAIEYVLDGDRELREVERELARLHAGTEPVNVATLGELQHRYEAIGGYSARARAAALLAGLGFAHARHEDVVASFSGGWRMRLNLAQALM